MKRNMASSTFPSQIHLIVITVLIIITLLTPITTNTSPQPWNILSNDNFAGKLTTASSSVESAATDFGHVTKIFPSAVLNPSSVQDITDLIKLSFDSQPSFPLAARGHGHSLRGQAAAKGGVVVNMRSMVNRDRGIKVSRTGLYADVDGAWLWIEVLNKTLELGLTPVSWTDYLYLTVGGTLSNGGISGQTFRYGPQISNVLEMDVITGTYHDFSVLHINLFYKNYYVFNFVRFPLNKKNFVRFSSFLLDLRGHFWLCSCFVCIVCHFFLLFLDLVDSFSSFHTSNHHLF